MLETGLTNPNVHTVAQVQQTVT